MVQTDTIDSREQGFYHHGAQRVTGRNAGKPRRKERHGTCISVTVRAGSLWATAGRGDLLTSLIDRRLGTMDNGNGRTRPKKRGDRFQEEEGLGQCMSPGGERRKSHKSHHP